MKRYSSLASQNQIKIKMFDIVCIKIEWYDHVVTKITCLQTDTQTDYYNSPLTLELIIVEIRHIVHISTIKSSEEHQKFDFRSIRPILNKTIFLL